MIEKQREDDNVPIIGGTVPDGERDREAFLEIVQEDDCVEQGISAEESFAQMRGMYQAMQYADAHYDETLKSASGLVGTEGTRMKRAREAGMLLCGDFIGKVMEKR